MVCFSLRSCRAHVLRRILSSTLGSDLRCDSIQDPRPPILVPTKVKSSVKRFPLARSMNAAAKQGTRGHHKGKRDNDGWRRHLALLCGVLMRAALRREKQPVLGCDNTHCIALVAFCSSSLPTTAPRMYAKAIHESSLHENSHKCVQGLRLI